MSGASEVIPGLLYLGSVLDASDEVGMKRIGITHVLTIGTGMSPQFPKEFSYQVCEIQDNPEEIIYVLVKPCIEFINHVKEHQGRVLVHCEAGVSRSASIVVAYIMYCAGPSMDSTTAIELVKTSRPIVSPNTGFRGQLTIFHECENDTNYDEKKTKELLDGFRDRQLIRNERVNKTTILSNDLFLEISSDEITDKMGSFLATVQVPDRFKSEKKMGKATLSSDDTATRSQPLFIPNAPRTPTLHKSSNSENLSFFGEAFESNCENPPVLRSILRRRVDSTGSARSSATMVSFASLTEEDDDDEMVSMALVDASNALQNRPRSAPSSSLDDVEVTMEEYTRAVKSPVDVRLTSSTSTKEFIIESDDGESTSSQQQKEQLVQEEEANEQVINKMHATTVVGKILLGFTLTASDEETVSHWLSASTHSKQSEPSEAFLGLRQALKMMRRLVRYNDGRMDDSSVEGLQQSLTHIFKTLGRFTGFQLIDDEDQTKLLRLLRSEKQLESILVQMQKEFIDALDDFSNQEAVDEEPSPEYPREVKLLHSPVPIAKKRNSVSFTPPVAVARPSSQHDRRRSATIDILLLFAKLGLRRDQSNDISDAAYMQFSQMLEGGAREKDALKNLDESTAIELLGYLDSLPKTIKGHRRMKRLMKVCEARLVLMVNENTAVDICDQLLSLKHISNTARSIISYTFHFVGACIGTKLAVKLEREDAGAAIGTFFKNHVAKRILRERQNAALQIQAAWRKDKVPLDISKQEFRKFRNLTINSKSPLLDFAMDEHGHMDDLATTNKLFRLDRMRKWESSVESETSETLHELAARTENRQKRQNNLLKSAMLESLGKVTSSIQSISSFVSHLSHTSRPVEEVRRSPRRPVSERLRLNPLEPTLHHAPSLYSPQRSTSTTSLEVLPTPVRTPVDFCDTVSVGSCNSSYYTVGDNAALGGGKSSQISCVHALQGLLKHLCRIVMSEINADMHDAQNSYRVQKLAQLQQHSKNLRLVHPRICVADQESRAGLSRLPKANDELSKYLKTSIHGMNQTPYVFDFELGVLAFFPPCDLDTALQPPNDTSAKFRKILGTVFDLMPPEFGGTKALLQITESATLSQHASAGYALTTCLHYIDKLIHDNETDYLTHHVLGDEQENVSGTVAGGYVSYDSESNKYIFTEESGHYGARWTLPGTRRRIDEFMKDSNLSACFVLKPFYRKNQPKSLASIFEGHEVSSPSKRVLSHIKTPEKAKAESDDDDEWDFN